MNRSLSISLSAKRRLYDSVSIYQSELYPLQSPDMLQDRTERTPQRNLATGFVGWRIQRNLSVAAAFSSII